MLQANPTGDFPQISRSAFIHETAVVVGNVRIGKNAFIGPLAVIRSDEPGSNGLVQPIVLEDGVNVQDAAIIHSLGGAMVRIGKNTSLAHGSLVHGPAQLGKNCFVGFRSIVFKSTLGDKTMVMHQVLVENVIIRGNRYIPPHACITTIQSVRKLPPVSAEDAAFSQKVAKTNQWLAQANQHARRRVLHAHARTRGPLQIQAFSKPSRAIKDF